MKSKSPPKPPHPKSVHDVEAFVKDRSKMAKKLHQPDGSKVLALKWSDAVAEATGNFVPPLTLKEQGLLTHLRNKCPTGQTGAVIEYAVSNWIKFVKQVEQDVGISKTPAKPNLQFLLLHVAVALSMMKPNKSKPKVKQEAKPVVKPTPMPVQLTSHDDDMMSPEELQAILNGDS